MAGVNLTDTDLSGANMTGCCLVSCILAKTVVSAKTNMTDAEFDPWAPPARKKASNRSGMSTAASAVCLAMPGLVCNYFKSGGNADDQGSDDDSDASDQEEMEQDESDLAQELGPVMDEIACAAAVVDGAMQDIVSVIRKRVLTPCRQELRKVVEANIRKIPVPPPRNLQLSIRESKHQQWLRTSKLQVVESIRSVLRMSIQCLFDDVLSEVFQELQQVIKQELDALEENGKRANLRSLGLELYQPKKNKSVERGSASIPRAAPAALATDLKSNLFNEVPNLVFGPSLKWQKVDAGPATALAQGRELKNLKLAAALTHKVDFTQQEWDTFGISYLYTDNFIKSGGHYFKPAETAVSDVMSTTDVEDANIVDTVEEVAANHGTKLAHIIRGQLVDQIMSVFDPDGKFFKKLRKQVESHADTLATETAGKIMESIWSELSVGYDQPMSAQSTNTAVRAKRFKSAALAVMAASRMRATHINIDLSTHLRVLEKACDSFDHFLLEEGLVGLAQKVIRASALGAVSVLSGSPADMFTNVDDPAKMLTQEQLSPLLPTVSVYEDMLDDKLKKVKGSSLERLMRPDSAKASLVKGMLKAATDYTMRASGVGAYGDMLKAAATFTRPQLAREEQDLMYVIERIKKLEELATTPETFRDVVDSWTSLLDLIPQISSQRALAVLQCLSSDKKLLSALGAGMALRDTVGEKPPASIVSRINKDAGQKIRANAYKYLRALEKELAIVRRTRDHQARGVALIGSALLSVFITIGSVVGRMYNDAIKEPDNSMLLWLIPVVFCGTIIVCCLCSIAAYRCLRGLSSSSARSYSSYQLLGR